MAHIEKVEVPIVVDALVREVEATILKLGPNDKLVLAVKDGDVEEMRYLSDVVALTWPDMVGRFAVVPGNIDMKVVQGDDQG